MKCKPFFLGILFFLLPRTAYNAETSHQKNNKQLPHTAYQATTNKMLSHLFLNMMSPCQNDLSCNSIDNNLLSNSINAVKEFNEKKLNIDQVLIDFDKEKKSALETLNRNRNNLKNCDLFRIMFILESAALFHCRQKRVLGYRVSHADTIQNKNQSRNLSYLQDFEFRYRDELKPTSFQTLQELCLAIPTEVTCALYIEERANLALTLFNNIYYDSPHRLSYKDIQCYISENVASSSESISIPKENAQMFLVRELSPTPFVKSKKNEFLDSQKSSDSDSSSFDYKIPSDDNIFDFETDYSDDDASEPLNAQDIFLFN